MVNVIPPDHVDNVPVVEPNQHDDVPVVPEPVLVDEDEDPEEEEFKEEEETQEEKDDMEDVTKVENMIEHKDETVPVSVHEVGESSTAPFLQEDSDGLLLGLMRRDINSLFDRMASLSRRLCAHDTTHALVKKKGKVKDEYYGKLILDLGNEVRSSVKQGTTAMKKLVERLGNVEEKSECKKLKKEIEKSRIMRPKFAPLTQAAISQMIKESVDAAIIAERARHANARNDARASGPVRGQDATPAVYECTFAGFMKCNPIAFLGFCPVEEVQRMKHKLWNLKVKEYNIVAYTQRFNELALMCPRMVELERVKVDAYIRGLTNKIKGEVNSSKPANLNEAMRMAHKLMEQKSQARDETILEGKKQKWENYQSGNSSGKRNHRENSSQTLQNNQNPCTIKCHKCGKVGYKARYCKEKNVSTSVNALPILTCYDCGERGHTRNRCLKKFKQEEVEEVRGRAYAIKDAEPQWLLFVKPDAVIVCGEKVVHIPYRNKTLIVESDKGVSRLKVISCITAQKSPDAVTTVLPTEEPEYSLSMGYEHLSTTTETESNKVTESSAKNLLPIPSEYEVTFDVESECDVPVKDESSLVFIKFSNPLFNDNDDFTSSDDESLSSKEEVPIEEFKVYSNPLFDNDEINFDKLDPYCFNSKSEFVKYLSNRDTLIESSPKFVYLEEFSGAFMPTSIADEVRIRREHAEYISLIERLFAINLCPRLLQNFYANTIVETLPSSPIPVQDSDSLREEIDIFTSTDELLPPNIESDDDNSEEDIHFLEELLTDDSIPLPENESSNFDHHDDPLFPRPPPKPPDVEFLFDLEPNSGEVISAVMNNIEELNEDECFDPGGEINVFANVKDDGYFPFIFVIQIFLPYLIYPEVSPLFLSAGSEDTIFDLGQGSPGRNKNPGPWSACIPMWQLFKGLGEDEHLDTISKMESDEVNKSSVEDLNLTPNTLIVSSPKFDSLLEKFSGEHAHIDLISPEIDDADFDLEEEIRIVEKLLYDNSSPRPPKELNSKNYDVVIESFFPSHIPVEGSDSLMEEIDISLALDDSIPPGIENGDYNSEGDILEELLNNDSLSLPENKSFHVDRILTVKVVDDIFERYVLKPIILPTQPTLSLCPVIDTLLSFSSENEDKVFNTGSKKHQVEWKAYIKSLKSLTEHQLKFNSIKDAKQLLKAVENRFGRNAATKKTQRNLLKQQYENFTASSLEMTNQTFDRLQKLMSQNKVNLDTMSMDDLYNNLQVYELEVKGMFGSSSSTQNMAFVSSSNNNSSSTNGTVNTAQAVNTANGVSTLALKLMLLSLQILITWLTVNGNETISFDKSNVECYNYHKRGHFSRECRALRNQDNKNKESLRRNVLVEISNSIALVSCDGLGGYDWSDQAEEGPNYSLMAFSSLISDSKVSNDSTCYKSCLETVKLLKSQNEQLLKDLKKSELMVLGLDKKFNKPVVENSNAKSSEEETKVVRKNDDAPIIKEWVSDNKEDNVVSRKNNMYSVDLKNIVLKGGLSFLFEKAISDESKLWHRRLGHLNFKTMNKLVERTPVKSLPSKLFKMIKLVLLVKKESSIEPLAEAVNTACYVQNRVLVVKPHNKTPYEIFHGRIPTLSFMRPFRCPIPNLNTIDHLGKFNVKADEGFFVRYSLNSKAFRVFNSRTRIVKENLHIRFSEITPNVVGSRPDWLYDIDALTRTMNYKPIVVGTYSSGFVDPKSFHDDGSKPLSNDGKKVDEDPRKQNECNDQEKEDNVNSTNNVNIVSSAVNVAGINKDNELPFDPNMPTLEDVNIFNFSNDDEDDNIVADMNNLESRIQVSHILTTRIHKDHPLDQVIRDLHSATQTIRMSKNLEEHRKNPKRFTKVKTASTPMETQNPLLKDKDGEEVDVHMYRVGKGFFGRVTPLLPTMVVQSELGEGSAMPNDPHHTPTILQPSSSQPQKTHKPRKPKRKNTQVPQLSGFTVNVTDEAVHKELGDSLVRAATTASSLEKEHDNGNINETQSKATPNEPSSQGTDSGGGPRIESSGDEESLGEDASKQGRRIDAIDQDEDITMVNVQDDAEMFDVNDLGVNAAQDSTATTTITTKEITLDQSLEALKTSKPMVKGIVIQEQEEPENKSSSGELDSTRPDVSKSLLFERNTLSGFSKGQYAVLIIQNMPYCLEEHIRCLDYRDQYAVLSGKADTLYPSGGYGVSVDLSEQDT
uniref:Reverse transcriptase domain-containing protein n=1 Tax=Tanacetum cinerariifolium TaxID=118510 RepID=A0A6L2KMJ1_TANCI|nr:reverse transcriptase domain-containing protein [Tanacetum cinerariifolium]